MPVELQRNTLDYVTDTPSALVNMCHASNVLSHVANEFLQAGRCLETSGEANRTAFDLAEYLFASGGVIRQQPIYGSDTKDNTTDRVMVMASVFTTLIITRRSPYLRPTELHPLDDGAMAKYKKTINSFGVLSSHAKQEWCEALSRGEDRAILLLLFSVLRRLDNLVLRGSTHCLPLRKSLQRTADFSAIRVLELSDITDKALSDSCRYIMTLSSLDELTFSDMSLTQPKIRNLRVDTLHIDTLRFLGCYATPAAVACMVTACRYLETFEYTVSGVQYYKSHDTYTGNKDLPMVDQLGHNDLVLKKITISSMDFVPKLDFLRMSPLPRYWVLEYLDVETRYLLSDKVNGMPQDRIDHSIVINTMSNLLQTLILRDCSWDKMLLVMHLFVRAKTIGGRCPDFTTLFVSYRRPMTENSSALAKLRKLASACEAAGINVVTRAKETGWLKKSRKGPARK